MIRLSRSLLILLSVASCASASAQKPDAIMAGRYVAPDGTIKTDTAIVLDRGKIHVTVARDVYTKTDNIVAYPNAVVCPGLIDVRSRIGAHDNLTETAHAIDPAASAIDSLDLTHRDFRAAVEAGITAVMLSPTENNLVSGVAATVKTARVSGDDPVLRGDGPLMFAVGSTVFSEDRAPTSRIGSAAMLREALDEAKAGRGHERMRLFSAGSLEGLVVCEDPMDVSAALRTLANGRPSIAIVHTSDAHDLAPELARGSRAVVVGPYAFGMSPRTLSTAGVYAAAGVPVVFAGGTPEASVGSLRTTAALAVRYGMDSAKARRAMTVLPATLAGVSERVGAIHPGLDADLVVFSDDPLRLDARVLDVYIKGVRVYHADVRADQTTGETP